MTPLIILATKELWKPLKIIIKAWMGLHLKRTSKCPLITNSPFNTKVIIDYRTGLTEILSSINNRSKAQINVFSFKKEDLYKVF